MIQKAGTGHRNHALHGFQDLELALSARFQHAVGRVHPDHELFAALYARRVQREEKLFLGRAPASLRRPLTFAAGWRFCANRRVSRSVMSSIATG
ncbi:hypothetical protein ACFSLT_19885 [Novosphingobium resinovorum]